MKGSVYKRCSSCGRNVNGRQCATCGTSNTNWAFRTYIGKDADGRWIEERRGGFATKREAERALTEVAASVVQGAYVRTSTRTLAEYLRAEWLPATAPPRVRYETWDDRRRNLENHVIGRIGGVTLQQLTAAHLNRLYGELLADGRVNGAGGLSPTSVRRIHAMLRKALNDAVRWGLLERNVALTADPPSLRAVRAARRRTMHTWTDAELRTFLAGTEHHPLHSLWVATAFTGLRRSEVLGLRWPDIDLHGAVLAVRATVVPGPDGYQLIEDHKSADSARTIHLDAHTVAVLKRHRRTVNAACAAAGVAWHDHRLVFPTDDGSWWNPPAITVAFQRAVKATGVPAIRLHDVRHTHATLLLRSGVNPKVVSERLGHSSVAFTLDTYAHVMPGMQPEAAELFRRLIIEPHADPDDPDDEDDLD